MTITSRPVTSAATAGSGQTARIIAFGTFRTELHPRVASLIEGLRDHDLRVDVVNEPLPLDTADRVGLLQHPWRLPRLAVALLRCWTRLAIRGRGSRRQGRPDAVLVGYLGHFDVHLARLVFPGVPVVLDHLVFGADTAADRGRDGRVLARVLRTLDTMALRRADIVVLDTEEHRAMAAPRTHARCVVVPVGATAEWFAVPARAQRDSGGLRVVFFGLFTPLQGTPVVAEAVRQLPGTLPVHVTLVGRGQDNEAVREVIGDDPRVRFVDWLSRNDLVAEVASADVVLGVFGTSGKAQRVVPTKVYQGVASGRLVVTSDTPPQRRALGGVAVHVPPGDAVALARALERLAADPREVARQSCAARRRAIEHFTARASVTELVAVLDELPASTRVQPVAAGRESLPLRDDGGSRHDADARQPSPGCRRS